MNYIISYKNNPVNLQQYIDNRDGFKRVEVKSFTYCWGWHNIHNEVLQKQVESPVRIQPGYYSVQQLAEIFHSYKISRSVNETSGRVTLNTPSVLKVSKRLKSVLGLQVKVRVFPKLIYQGDRPLNFAVIKALYLHLSDIHKYESHNYHHGIQKYERGINLTDGIDTALISTSGIMAGISDATFRNCCNCLWMHWRLREIGEA